MHASSFSARTFAMLVLVAITTVPASVLLAGELEEREERAVGPSSSAAESRLLEDFGASVGEMHSFYLGPRPELPIRDKDGKILPASCGPHINLTSDEIPAKKVRQLLSLLNQIVPNRRRSHVALYLKSSMHDRKNVVAEIRRSIPQVVVFDESQLPFMFR